MPRYRPDVDALVDLAKRSPKMGAMLAMLPLGLVGIGAILTIEYPGPMAVMWGLALLLGVGLWVSRRRQRRRFAAIVDEGGSERDGSSTEG